MKNRKFKVICIIATVTVISALFVLWGGALLRTDIVYDNICKYSDNQTTVWKSNDGSVTLARIDSRYCKDNMSENQVKMYLDYYKISTDNEEINDLYLQLANGMSGCMYCKYYDGTNKFDALAEFKFGNAYVIKMNVFYIDYTDSDNITELYLLSGNCNNPVLEQFVIEISDSTLSCSKLHMNRITE